MVPVGEKTELYIGDSRDIVVTQRKMKNEKVNVRYNNRQNIILYDNDEVITAKIENFKDKPAVLTMIQHIQGQWKMIECTLDKKKLVLGEDYKKKDAYTLEFEINLDNRTESGPFTRNLVMHYQRLNIRP